LKNRGTLLAEKDETKTDLIFNGIGLEIVGANKNPKLADFVIQDNINLPVRNCIPMWVLGMGLWGAVCGFCIHGVYQNLAKSDYLPTKEYLQKSWSNSGFI